MKNGTILMNAKIILLNTNKRLKSLGEHMRSLLKIKNNLIYIYNDNFKVSRLTRIIIADIYFR